MSVLGRDRGPGRPAFAMLLHHTGQPFGLWSIAMRDQTLFFRLTAATAVAGLVLAQVIPQSALAQPAPPGGAAAAPDQQTPDQQTPDQQAADPPERAGWLAQVNGTVSYHTQDQDQWSPAAMNYPVASGDAFWTEPNASARVAISSSLVALAGGTELDVGTLDFNGLQATFPQGEVYLRLRDLAQNETWSVQTPRGLVMFSGAGRYGVAAGDTQNPTTVTVLEGSAQVTGPGLSLQVAQGQTATITGTDTLHGSVGPAQLDAFLTATQQADQPPPASAAAPPPVVAQIPGGDDLSAYGSWSQTTDYGDVWYPQVAAGWAPYQSGHWAYIPPWGWTWVDDAPWGFAPFHYGRWFQTGGRWGWTPGVVAVSGPPVYAPALVAFIGLGVGVGAGIGAVLSGGSIGWVPLGPREPYHPWYHSSERYLRSVNRFNVTNVTEINNRNVTINNFANRAAMTVVPERAMAESRPVRQAVQHVDPRELETARPVIGTAPIRPTASTAGITPGLAREMHLPPAPGGVAAAARVAPGPAIHPGPPVRGVAARPALRPAEPRQGAVPEPAAGRPAGTPGHVEPGARPGVVAAPGAMPALRTPAEREGGPPSIEHPAPSVGERPGAMPVQEQRPGATPAERPGEAGARPPGEAPAEHPPVGAPLEAGAPGPHAPAVEGHAAARPEEHAPAAEENAAPRPEVHAAPVPEEHPAQRPEEHPAPRREEHPAPRPEEHPAPRPEEHPAPRPEEHPAPRPEERPAPRPEEHPAPRPEPRPAPEARPAPAAHPAPAPHREDERR